MKISNTAIIIIVIIINNFWSENGLKKNIYFVNKKHYSYLYYPFNVSYNLRNQTNTLDFFYKQLVYKELYSIL